LKMKILWLLPLCALLTAGCVTTTGSASQKAIIRAKEKVGPSLVHIRPVKEVFASGKREEVQVVGSGFIISPDGYVVTNEHVAGQSKFVRCVLFNKEEVAAHVIGIDPYTDIAVLKLDMERADLPAVELGDSSRVKQGQTVLAMGSPHGLSRSVSLGIISVTDRYLEDRGEEMVSPFNTWLQTDAAINPGNSGGPLVDIRGKVIGINARVLHGAENVGFAIPINAAKGVIDQLIKDGRVVRSWIGESLQPMRAKTDDPDQDGVVIGDIDPLSPGYEAGLRPGDVMLSVDGTPTNARFEEDLPVIRQFLASLPVGKQVQVAVQRGTEQMTVPVVTAERVPMKGVQQEFTEWGFTAVDVTPTAVRLAQLPSRTGVLVTGAQAGTIAANARLQNGDIILTMDGAQVPNLAKFQEMYAKLVEAKKPLVMLEVKRGSLGRFVLIKQTADDGSTAEAANGDGEGGLERVD